MMRWYVIQTKPRQEKTAELNLQRQGFQCFTPRIKQWRKYRGKRTLMEEAFFPNYLFVYLDLYLTNCLPIRSTRGVSKMVRFGNQTYPVPKEVINALKANSDDNNVVNLDAPEYQPGQTVTIEEGPLAGLTAIFQAKNGQDRAILLLNMLGKQQKVEVPLAMLE